MKKIVIVLTFLLMLTCSFQTKAASTYEEWAKFNTLESYGQVDLEMRAVWVSPIVNDIPKQKGTDDSSINAWKEYYISVLETCKSYNLNTIIFHVRPSNDAFYPSKYNPWSEFLYSYGKDPGWDPLEWMVEVTHEYGMEYHAWLNPYRASTSTVSVDPMILSDDGSKVVDYNDSVLQANKANYFANLKKKCEKAYDGTDVDNPVFAEGEQLKNNVVMGTGKQYVLNPASETTIKHIENTIREIVENYEVDGIHFDDYFYPNDTSYSGTNTELKGYTYSFEPYVDMADYKAYLSKGGNLNIYDWRRSNVDALIKNLSDMIREINTTRERPCVFGISPCGRWAPSPESCSASEAHRTAEGGMDASCGGYYSYSDLFANTKKWVDEEWIDYILPQVYSRLTDSYEEVVEWWSEAMKDSSVKLYIGTGLYLHDSMQNNTDEIYWQVRYNQSNKNNIDGYAIFNYKCILDGDAKADMDMIKKSLWKTNALTPTYGAYEYKHTVSSLSSETKIAETAVSNRYRINLSEVEDAKAYAIYKALNEDASKYISGEKEFTPADMLILNLQGNNTVNLAYDQNYTYFIATVSMDNTIYLNTTPINFNNIELNEAPSITLLSELKRKILAGTTINLKFKIEDKNGDEFTYSIYLGKSKLPVTELGDGIYEISWKSYYVETLNLKFKVTASDGKASNTFETELFDVVEVCPHEYSEATCTDAPKCIYCEITNGTSLGHNYKGGSCTEASTCERCSEDGPISDHVYSDANCVEPQKCTVCGETIGSSLGHSWQEATEEAPKTCTRCGTTEGEKLPQQNNQEAPKKKGCKKSSVAYLLVFSFVTVLGTLLFRRRGK